MNEVQLITSERGVNERKSKGRPWRRVQAGRAVICAAVLLVLAGPVSTAGSGTNSSGAPEIEKKGTVDVALVETTPIVFIFKRELWRFESVRESYHGNDLGKAVYHGSYEEFLRGWFKEK